MPKGQMPFFSEAKNDDKVGQKELAGNLWGNILNWQL